MASSSHCVPTITIPLLLSIKGTMTQVGLLSGIHNSYEIPFVARLKAKYTIVDLKLTKKYIPTHYLIFIFFCICSL